MADLQKPLTGDAVAQSVAEPRRVAALVMAERRLRRSAAVVTELSEKLSCSVSHAGTLIEATAEVALNAQRQQLERVCMWVQSLARANAAEALSFTHRRAFDETPLRLRVAVEEGEGQQVQLAKVFLIQSSWSALLRRKRMDSGDFEYILLHGESSPQVRAADSGKAEAIIEVLRSTSLVPMFLSSGLPRKSLEKNLSSYTSVAHATPDPLDE